ncbi:MAG: phage major capsid protein [Lachnospiraceae bacterium]|nr:phage major capsid protein [Lachnospiraceae bacterium]
MGRRKFLEKRLNRLLEKRNTLQARALASNDAAEVRSINDQIADINADIAEAREEIDLIDSETRDGAQAGSASHTAAEEGDANAQEENRGLVPENARLINPVGSFRQANGRTQAREENPLGTMEYRTAFREYFMNGTPIPAELRSGDAISTVETGAAIPMTIMNQVINTVRKRYGNLYAKVRKLSVKGGVAIPIGALQATFKWINQSTVSPRQKTDKLGNVQFSFHTAEIRVAQSFLSYVVTMDAFEAEIARVIAIAYMQAMDEGIVSGSGNGQMLGILNDPRVVNTVTLTAAEINNWTAWRKKFFSKLPLGYRAGEFIFASSTVESYLETMADSNNNPIFRQATGLETENGDGRFPDGRFFGRSISLVEPDILADFDTASQGDVIGIFWQPEEYAINENFGFTMRRYFDEETNEYVDKALVVVDGKVLNPTGYYKILKG